MVAVGVPAAGIIDDDVGNPDLDHAAGGEAILPKGVAAVTVTQFRFLFR
jgi:hypothetical protein